MNLITAKVSPTLHLWEYKTAGIVETKMQHFQGPKAQSHVLWGSQAYGTSKEDFMSKDNALWRYQELSVYCKCGKTMSHWAANLSVWQKIMMASSSSLLNTCLFYSFILICSRDCLALCRSSCGKHSCPCRTVSQAVQEPI